MKLLRHVARNAVKLSIAPRIHIRPLSTSRSLGRHRKDVQLKESYYHATSTVPFRGTTIGKMFDSAVEQYPDRTAVVFSKDDVRRTFRQLQDEVDRLAAGLAAIGLERGDRIGIWGPNVLEWVLTQYATAKLGLILVNINPAYRANELEYVLKKVGVKALVAEQTFKTQDYYAMIQEICPEITDARPGHLNSENLPELTHVIMMGAGSFKGALMLDDVMSMATEERKETVAEIGKSLQFDDPINIMFTSGTTGLPKGVTSSHNNIINNCYFVGNHLGYSEKHHIISCPAPLFHTFGMVNGSLSAVCHGSTVVFPSPSFQAEPTLKAIEQERCTSHYGTPTMYIDMLNHPNMKQYDMSSLSTGLMAGSPCPVEVMKRCMTDMNMHDIKISYGLTETGPVTNITCTGDPVELTTGTVGKAVDHTELKVVDPESGHIVPVNETGELCQRGYCIMMGYWGDPDKTKESIDSSNWFHSGDLATMDENGYVRIVGRIKDMVIRGGENIYPSEIEQFLHKHPKVEDVQVIGLPDDRMGEEVCACIKLKAGQTATPEEIKDFCKGEIAHFKIPRYVEFVEEFPMTNTLKIQKYLLREKFSKKLNLVK